MRQPHRAAVIGSFTKNRHPVQGWVRFTPERLWVVRDGVTWACLAPVVPISPSGHFQVYLTATDTDSVPWHYRVETPAGDFRITVPGNRHAYTLKELIGEHHPDPRSPH